MIVMGVICILMGLLGLWMGNGWYQEARMDLPVYESKKCKKQGDFCFTIGILASLIGVFFIIGNFTII